MLDEIRAKIDPLCENLYSLACVSDAGEEVWRCRPSNACNDLYSVAKAFVASAVGLLWDRGLLRLDEPLLRALKAEPPAGADARWARVTVDNALSHAVGFAQPGLLDIDVDDSLYASGDFLALLLARPLGHEPGERFVYTDAAYYLLARAVEAASGEEFGAFVWRELLSPLDAREVAWSRCPQGHAIGATGMYARAVVPARLGWLYVNGGLYGDARLLSRAWTETALRRGFSFSPLDACPDVYAKGGMNGQMLLFSPARRFSVAWQGFLDGEANERVLSAALSALA